MWQEISNLLKNRKERFIIIEDGKPKYVILEFNEYKNLIESNDNPASSDLVYAERANREIAKLKKIEHEEIDVFGKDEEISQDVRVEDLPF